MNKKKLKTILIQNRKKPSIYLFIPLFVRLNNLNKK